MRFLGRGLWRGIKILVAGWLILEFACFLIVTLSIYFVYGQFREGEPVRYDPYALYINRQGERPTAYNASAEKSGDLLTLWMFGGSTTRGISEDDRQTVPSFLAKFLNQEPPVLPARVTNFGVDGFNSLMESKYLQKMLIECQKPPTIIIFYDGANDCAYFGQYRTPYAHHGYRQLRGVIESYHQSFFGMLKPLNAAWHTSYVRELWDKMRQGVIPISPQDPALKEFVDSAVKRYDYVNQVAGCFGATFQVIWQPCWWVETAPVSAAVEEQARKTIILGDRWALRDNFIIIYNALADRLRDKPYFVDFRNILCPRQEPVYESDGIHLNPAGDMMVASEIGQFIKKKRGAPRQAALRK